MGEAPLLLSGSQAWHPIKSALSSFTSAAYGFFSEAASSHETTLGQIPPSLRWHLWFSFFRLVK